VRRYFVRKHDYTAVFWFVVGYKREHDGLSPSLREIKERFGYRSFSACRYVLARLERDGLISRSHKAGAARAIRVTGGAWDLRTIPEGMTEPPVGFENL
jgi:SOS-response transcriptional repressor LexA